MNELDLFTAAIAIADPAERNALLNRECAGRDALRQRLEQLLDAHARTNPLLDPARTPDPRVTHSHKPSTPLSGTIIAGRYKLLEEIGDGGMGTVWMAEQKEPVKRLVAVKLIKAGMDSKAVLARFEAERQALAMMDHPNIAKVHDAGTDDAGRPYFVMELVKGLPLTEYCDARKLSVNDRLDLFVQICSAVQHAHQKAVIHRDLKPTNVLVTEHDGKPVPKVIDFGLAKALHGANTLTDRTLHTAYGAVVGTPLYMAPEQVGINALDVDTRTDIYALGVILYELLTGSTPLEKARFKEAAWEEMKRLIREEEPPRPSTRLSSSASLPSLAASRQIEPAKLSRIVRGELDWIVMKALEKDRTRRYDTANGLAKDVQRYRSGDAVEACPPTFAYRMWKAYRRNKTAVWVGAAFTCLGIGAVAMGAVLTRQAIDAQQLAAIQRDAAEAARQAEAEQRVAAEESQLRAQRENEAAKAAGEEVRRNLYFAAMNLIPGVSKAEQYGRVMELLDQQRPKPGESDLRGFEWHYWNRLYQGDRREIKLDSYRLPFVLSDDGRWGTFGRSTGPAVLSSTDTLDVMDLANGSVVKSWGVPKFRGGQLLMSANGQRVALMCLPLEGKGGRLVVWNAKDGNELLKYDVNFIFLGGKRAALSPDGKRIAFVEGGGVRTAINQGSTSFVVKIWDLDEPRRDPLAIPILASRKDVEWLTFNSDGTRLALGIVDRRPTNPTPKDSEAPASTATLTVLNLATGKPGPFVDLETRSLGLSFSPDGARLTAVAASPLRTIQWQIEADGRLRELRSTPIDVDGPQPNLISYGLSTSPDGRVHAISSTQSANVWLVDAGTGQKRDVVKSPGNVRSAVFHADGRRMWTVNSRTLDSRSEIVLNEWNLFRERLVRTERTPPLEGTGDTAPITIHCRDGERTALFWPESGKLSVRDRAGKDIQTMRITPAPKLTVRENGAVAFAYPFVPIAFSPNGRHLMAIPMNGPAKIFDTESGMEKWSGSGFTGFGLRAFNKRVEMSPKGDLIALPDDQGFKIVNTDDLTERAFIPTEATQVYFSPDRRRLVAVARRLISGDTETVPRMSLWDLEGRREIHSVPIGSDFVLFSENGRRFASIDDGYTRVWDAETGLKLSDLGRGSNSRSGFFNPEGTSFLNIDTNATNADSLPAVWDTTTGILRFRLDGLTGSVVAANFSRDGKRITTATRNGLDVKLWDASTGRELLTLTGIHVGRSGALLYFSDDGYQLTLGNRQGAEVVWDVTPRKDAQK